MTKDLQKDAKPHAKGLAPNTVMVTGGRNPHANHGFLNPPVYHASTVLYPTAADFLARRARYTYGRHTPTMEALETAVQELEGPRCAGVALAPSGLNAITTALLSVVSAGDHVLMTDNVYRPARNFSDTTLKKLGVETTYFDPLIGPEIERAFRPNTRVLYLEAPGSLSFEMQDVPALAEIAHAKGALVLFDNTWASPYFFSAFDKGVDLSIQAGTKYLGGHSDVMIGTISANETTWPALRDTVRNLGLCVGPDDAYLTQRGVRTLGVRLDRHFQSGMKMAEWFAARPEVERVLHPGLPNHPGHAIWKRDFRGASGLFSVVLKPASETAFHTFLNTLTLFGMGASWGGYESLAIPFDCAPFRTATTWNPGGPAVRFHIGLEDIEDLKADLDRGFAAMRAAA
jgi:cysteine-S-conjugate beta-lyase